MDLRGKRVFITGAASGIGRATAFAVAAEGSELYLTDRDASPLAATAAEIEAGGGRVAFAKPADVADVAQVQALGREIHERAPSMDVVMNVAGIAVWGTVDRLQHAQWRKVVDVNLMGPIHVIETFVPPMIAARRGGHLVNVSSAAGLVGLPWHAPYSATKFGLRGISEVLRFDLEANGIGVSLVCPGGVRTPLADTVEIAGLDKAHPAYVRMQARFRRHAVTPEQAAAAIVRGVRRNRYLVYTSNDIRLIHLVERVCPPLYVLLMRGMHAQVRRALEAAAA